VVPTTAATRPARVNGAEHGTPNQFARVDRPNVMIKIPGTLECLGAIEDTIAAGINVNVTLIFSLDRHDKVIDAYQKGLTRLAESGGDLSTVHSVASFFVSRVDTEVDQRLDKVGTDEAKVLRGQAAVAQAKLAYQMFLEQFSGARWDALAAAGAHVQRPLWASTSTKNAAYPDTLYVDNLIGPDTVNTLPEVAIAAFEDHGVLSRTIDTDISGAAEAMERLARVGIDLDDVGRVLEEQGVASFHDSFAHVLGALSAKASQLGHGR
jgi:transaldolase